MMDDTQNRPSVEPDSLPDDEFRRRDAELSRALDKLENEALDTAPKPPGVGAMF